MNLFNVAAGLEMWRRSILGLNVVLGFFCYRMNRLLNLFMSGNVTLIQRLEAGKIFFFFFFLTERIDSASVLWSVLHAEIVECT